MKSCIRVARNGHLAHPIPTNCRNWRADQVGLCPQHFPYGADPFLKRYLAHYVKYP
jgi:hypothetical protein